MLDMGFADAIKKIIQTVTKQLDEGKKCQRVLLSATPTTGLIKIFMKKINYVCKIQRNINVQEK